MLLVASGQPSASFNVIEPNRPRSAIWSSTAVNARRRSVGSI
ncbi:MAG: hypothetical protein R2749_23855 [Acidimicrobiales bacterium]